MLIRAMYRWPEVITKALWPNAVSLDVNIRNKSKLDGNGVSLIEKIITVKHSLDEKDNDAFGCSACAL